MNLENALIELNKVDNNKDILEILGIEFNNDFINQKYYSDRINLMNSWDYFVSDLDWTFFRWVLQKEAFSLFVKFIKKQNFLDLDLDNYCLFLKDVEFFNELEKKAYNKEIEYFEYLNAGIYLLLKHKSLINWEEYLSFISYNFKIKEKINPFRFSFSKIKEVLESWNNFIFVSWAPDFIFDIYLKLLKEYITKYLLSSSSNIIPSFESREPLPPFFTNVCS